MSATDMTTSTSPSEVLQHLQSLLQQGGTAPQHVVEYFIPHEQVEPLKDQIRTETKGLCYFFTKPLEDRTHVIAYVNITDVADTFEKALDELKKREAAGLWQSNVAVTSPREGPAAAQEDF